MNLIVERYLRQQADAKLASAKTVMPGVVTRLILEVSRHRESLRIIRMGFGEAEREKLLPGLPAVEKENAEVLKALGERP